MKNLLLACYLILLPLAYGQQSLSDLTFGPQKESLGKTLDDIVAIAGNDVITRREYTALPQKNRKAALQRLIMRKLLLQEAAKYNISVGDTALNIATEQSPRKVRSRQKLREDLTISKLQQQVVSSLVQVSNLEISDIVDKQLKKINDRVNLVDILIRVPQSADPDVLNQAQELTREVEKKLKTQSPQTVASQYADVSYNKLGWIELSAIPPLFSKVLVDTPINQYTQPIVDQDGIHILKVIDNKNHHKNHTGIAQARVSHILIKDEDNPTAKTTINRIYKELRGGADFALLAKQYSQDIGSSVNGGSLGWISPGQMVPTFDAMVRQTKTGHISRPFKSRYGYHILKVDGRRQQTLNNREALEQQAKQTIFERRAVEEWDLWLARLREESHVEIFEDNR